MKKRKRYVVSLKLGNKTHAIKQAEEDLKGYNSPHKAEYCIKEN